MDIVVSHIGICVSDLDRSRRFYEGLGFEERFSHRVGAEFATLMEIEGVDMQSVMLARDGVTIELLGSAAPRATSGIRSTAGPMNELGLHPPLAAGWTTSTPSPAVIERLGRNGGGRRTRTHPRHGRRRSSTSSTAPIPTGCASSS